MADDELELYADLLAAPYQRGSKGEHGRYDCYSLLQTLYARMGIVLADQPRATRRADLEALVLRDLVKWKAVRPVGVNDPLAITSCDTRLADRQFALRPYNAIQLNVGGFHCHVGMVLPNRRVIHTWEQSGCVVIEPLDDYRWENNIVGVYYP